MNQNKKALLFGNGVSMNFAYDEYKPEALRTKFLDGWDSYFRMRNSNGVINFYMVNVQEVEAIIKEGTFNEGTIFNAYKEMVAGSLINNVHSHSVTEKERKEVEDVLSLVSDSSQTITNNQKYDAFRTNYETIWYMVARSICINNDHSNWIDIRYNKEFLGHIAYEYKQVYTTNYYVGNLPLSKLTFLHGKIDIDDDIFINNQNNLGGIENIRGDEFPNKMRNRIYFGNTYEDKVRLKSLVEWNYRQKLVEKHIQLKEVDKFDEIDILGLSTDGDKHIIEGIKRNCKIINVYCHSASDKEKWEKELKDSASKVNFYCTHEFPGFNTKENRDHCCGCCNSRSSR